MILKNLKKIFEKKPAEKKIKEEVKDVQEPEGEAVGQK